MKNKILLIHLPRTGGTYLSHVEQRGYIANFQCAAGHKTINQISNKDAFFTIGAVRNPFDWYVSRFEYFCNTRPDSSLEGGVSKYNDLGLNRTTFQAKIKTLKSHLLEGLERQLSRFWLSDMYHHCFCDVDQQLIIDYVYRFENMDNEFRHILKINNLSIVDNISQYNELRNSSTRKPYKHSQYYDQELIDLIYKKDKIIFDQYKYDFERGIL